MPSGETNLFADDRSLSVSDPDTQVLCVNYNQQQIRRQNGLPLGWSPLISTKLQLLSSELQRCLMLRSPSLRRRTSSATVSPSSLGSAPRWSPLLDGSYQCCHQSARTFQVTPSSTDGDLPRPSKWALAVSPAHVCLSLWNSLLVNLRYGSTSDLKVDFGSH